MVSELAQFYALIRRFEGCKLTAYFCPAGVVTIGFGSTGPDIRPGDVWTQAQADARMQADALRFAKGTLALCPALRGNDLCAIADFAYNLGLGRLKASTLRRKINTGQMESVGTELAKWTRGGGRVLPGLVKRRAAEAAIFGT